MTGRFDDVPRFVLGDVVRYAAAGSVVVGTVGFGFIGFALFMLVLGASVLPRALAAPVALDVAFGVTLLIAAWAAELDWYLEVSWLDVVVHAAASGLIAAVAYAVLARLGVVPQVADARVGSAIGTTTLGTTLAVVWEGMEWWGHTYLDNGIQVGYHDTLGDLAAGTVGSIVAAVVLARSRW